MKKSILILCMLLSMQVMAQTEMKLQIEDLLEKEVTSDHAPGMIVGVIKDGELIYHGHRGLMNLSYELPFNDSTCFGVASVTKQFTAACIGILANGALLSVDDDIRKYVPELPFYEDTIRIRHLLNHTSGIRNHNVLLDLSGFDYEHQGYTNASIEQLMFRQKGVNNRPGEKMLYANTNYVLLALVVKRVSGMPIHQFAEKELFQPLGMNHTFYRHDLGRIVKNQACTYYQEKDGFKQKKSLTLCVGAGGLGTTVDDLAKWSQLFLDQKHDFAFLADFLTVLDTLPDGSTMKHARGIFVSDYKGIQTLNHSGRDIGMRAQLICVPKLGISIIVYANSSQYNAVDFSYKLLDLWMPDQKEEKNKKESCTHSVKELKQHIGTYQELNSDLRLQFFVQHDTLFSQSSFGRQGVPLCSATAHSFLRVQNASVSYVFSADKERLKVDFGGAIFYLERVELTANPNERREDFVGEYFSEELGITYRLAMHHDQLVLTYPNSPKLILNEGEKDVFGANRRTKYSFQRDEHGAVTHFLVAAEGTVKDILFTKIDTEEGSSKD